MSKRTCCALAGLGVILLVSGCGPSMAVHQAIEKGQTEEALALIAEGKCLKDVTPEGRTALHDAARYGNAEVAKALIGAGLDIEQPCEKQNYRPLYLAAARGHVAVARVLVDHGANVESECASGGSALLIASLNGREAVVELLLEHGADVNHQADNGMSPLTAAARGGHLGILRLLLRRGADPNLCEKGGITPLLEAAIARKTEAVKLLATQGVNVRAATEEGYTALMECAKAGDLEAVKILVEKGSDVEARFSPESMSALHYAAFLEHTETMEYLVMAGAKLYTIDEGPGTYSTAVSSKWYGYRCERGGSLDEAVEYYARAGQYYDKAVGYFEEQAENTAKRIDDIHTDDFLRAMFGGIGAAMTTSAGGYGYASYRISDVSHLEQQKKTHLERAAQCRQLADVCRKLVDCYAEHASDPKAREEHARMLKDQLGLR
jgi:ankyrin repeat protein